MYITVTGTTVAINDYTFKLFHFLSCSATHSVKVKTIFNFYIFIIVKLYNNWWLHVWIKYYNMPDITYSYNNIMTIKTM